jgi:hypothetical protein
MGAPSAGRYTQTAPINYSSSSSSNTTTTNININNNNGAAGGPLPPLLQRQQQTTTTAERTEAAAAVPAVDTVPSAQQLKGSSAVALMVQLSKQKFEGILKPLKDVRNL